MNAIGYLVLGTTVLIFSLLIVKKIRQMKIKKVTQEVGYALLLRTYEEKNHQGQIKYFGFFQQSEKEWVLELQREQYLRLQVPMRGYLTLVDGRINSFE